MRTRLAPVLAAALAAATAVTGLPAAVSAAEAAPAPRRITFDQWTTDNGLRSGDHAEETKARKRVCNLQTQHGGRDQNDLECS